MSQPLILIVLSKIRPSFQEISLKKYALDTKISHPSPLISTGLVTLADCFNFSKFRLDPSDPHIGRCNDRQTYKEADMRNPI